jgi:hypothetical protein
LCPHLSPIECDGAWSQCVASDSSGETHCTQQFLVHVAAEHGGTLCDAEHEQQRACLCPAPPPPPSPPPAPVYSANCHGYWSPCDSDCKETYDVYTSAQGDGRPCPVAHGTVQTCSPGVGHCPQHNAQTSSGGGGSATDVAERDDPRWRTHAAVGCLAVFAVLATVGALFVDARRGELTRGDGQAKPEKKKVSRLTSAGPPDLCALEATVVCSTSKHCGDDDGSGGDDGDGRFFENPARASAMSLGRGSSRRESDFDAPLVQKGCGAAAKAGGQLLE